MRMIEWFNQLARIACTEIVQEKTVQARAKAISSYIKVHTYIHIHMFAQTYMYATLPTLTHHFSLVQKSACKYWNSAAKVVRVIFTESN